MFHRIAPRFLVFASIIATLFTISSPLSAHAEPGVLPFKPGITIGGVMGRLSSETIEGEALGVYGQLDIGRIGFMAEVGRASYASSERIDRLAGAGITARIISISDVSLFVRGSTGVSRATLGETTIANQVYLSAGGGVGVLLTRNIALTLEGLMTARKAVSTNDDDLTAIVRVPDTEELTHLRLGLTFSI